MQNSTRLAMFPIVNSVGIHQKRGQEQLHIREGGRRFGKESFSPTGWAWVKCCPIAVTRSQSSFFREQRRSHSGTKSRGGADGRRKSYARVEQGWRDGWKQKGVASRLLCRCGKLMRDRIVYEGTLAEFHSQLVTLEFSSMGKSVFWSK